MRFQTLGGSIPPSHQSVLAAKVGPRQDGLSLPQRLPDRHVCLGCWSEVQKIVPKAVFENFSEELVKVGGPGELLTDEKTPGLWPSRAN